MHLVYDQGGSTPLVELPSSVQEWTSQMENEFQKLPLSNEKGFPIGQVEGYEAIDGWYVPVHTISSSSPPQSVAQTLDFSNEDAMQASAKMPEGQPCGETVLDGMITEGIPQAAQCGVDETISEWCAPPGYLDTPPLHGVPHPMVRGFVPPPFRGKFPRGQFGPRGGGVTSTTFLGPCGREFFLKLPVER